MRRDIPKLFLLSSFVGVAAAQSGVVLADEGWRFEVTPYIWAAGLDADVEVRDRSASVDQDFDDILDSVEINAALMGTAQYNQWLVFTQFDYLALDSDNLDDAPARGSLDADLSMVTVGFGYQFGSREKGATLDLMLGARYLSLETELDLDGIGTFDNDRSVTDPIIILRPSLRLSEKWRFEMLAAAGAGGDSEEVYELQPQLQYQANDWISVRVGYRWLDYRIDSDNGSGNNFNGSFEGPILGLGMTWGHSPKPVAATPAPEAAPAPPPPPPAPVVNDGDGDGVADGDDQCPRSRPGESVDTIGCGYNIYVEAQFDTDSAVIKPESFEALDIAADLLKRVPTIRGVIEGHTDSTGTDAYNQQLSERRAKAVSDYLIQRGIDASRIPSRGLGEAQPEADNETPEGRAQNRRVVLRRTDRNT